ncbi:hypothetical protein SNOG_04511 [Parastagonospora nodorum SN15]|uniref:Uncharacterized protein n=1 Tax=Phaeosphaeria nodorum (strain SN15 / ATCC MYA-4574 / FGSC 10173) TaxID=321614 RepID=Q0UUQ3_PHANO|nr:hypothetical protein SNOG_04511 [Parastagonospora nodorum SN15]EAT88271.1 hypothetical protein SNOG_04511 [Parastagonospora nodorum SN15]
MSTYMGSTTTLGHPERIVNDYICNFLGFVSGRMAAS